MGRASHGQTPGRGDHRKTTKRGDHRKTTRRAYHRERPLGHRRKRTRTIPQEEAPYMHATGIRYHGETTGRG